MSTPAIDLSGGIVAKPQGSSDTAPPPAAAAPPIDLSAGIVAKPTPPPTQNEAEETHPFDGLKRWVRADPMHALALGSAGMISSPGMVKGALKSAGQTVESFTANPSGIGRLSPVGMGVAITDKLKEFARAHNLAPQTVLDQWDKELSWREKVHEFLQTHGVEENIGAGGEQILEFMAGEGLLKGLGLAVRGEHAAQGVSWAERLAGRAVRTVRGAAVAAGQAQLHGEGAEAAGTTAGVVGGVLEVPGAVLDLVRPLLQHGLGIAGDLAARVETKVARAESLRQETQAKLSGLESSAASEQAAIQQTAERDTAASEARLGAMKGERDRQVMRITADAAQAVQQEEARVSQPFAEIAEAMSNRPVGNAAEMRALVYDAADNLGVQHPEVPKKVFASLGNRGLGITLAGARAGEFAESDLLSFNDLTRFRNDLFEQSRLTKDGATRAALTQAFDEVTKLQQAAAEAAGFGEKYGAAKRDFALFKRELGSGLMNDFLSAQNTAEQAAAPRLALLTTRQDAEALRTLLNKAGVDASPLDRLLADMARERRAPLEIRKTASEAASATRKDLRTGTRSLQSELADKLKEVEGEAKDRIVPGQSDLDLAGHTNQQLKAMRIEALMKGMAAKGIKNPYGFAMIGIGMARMLMGSPFGAMTATLGAAKVGSGALAESPRFQNYVLREAGIDSDSALGKRMRQALVSWGAQMRGKAAAQPR